MKISSLKSTNFENTLTASELYTLYVIIYLYPCKKNYKNKFVKGNTNVM